MKILPINNIYNNYTQHQTKLSKPSVKQSPLNCMSNSIYYIPAFKGKIPATDKEYKLMFEYLKSNGRDFSTETISKEMPYFDELCKKFKFDINKKFDNEKETLYELAKRGAWEAEDYTYYGINKFERFIFHQFPLEKASSIMLSIHHYLPLRTFVKEFNSPSPKDRLEAFEQFKKLYDNETNQASKRTALETFIGDVLLSYNQLTTAERIQFAAQFPVSIIERDFMNADEIKEFIRPELIAPLKNQRLKNIIDRNGIGTQEKLLACLNDELMAPELLDIPYAYDNHSNIIKDIAQTEDAVAMQKFLDKLSEMPFIPNSDEICEAANIAGRSGNIKLLQLLKSKKVNLEQCRQNVGEFTPEVQKFFSNLKIQNPRLVEDLMNVKPYEMSQVYDLSKYDINSRDKDGNTIILKAARILDLSRIKALKDIDDVDWNATNKQGENISMIILNRMNTDDYSPNNKLIKAILAELRELPEGKFDINYVNQTPIYGFGERIPFRLPYTTLNKFFLDRIAGFNDVILDELLQFKNINPNICPNDSIPLLQWLAFSPPSFNMFNKLYHHPNTDRDITYLGQHWLDNLLHGDILPSKSSLILLNDIINFRFVDKIKAIYEENGSFSINEIEKFIEYDNFKQIMMQSLNSIGENIGHFLPEIFVKEGSYDYTKLRKICEKLQDAKFDFSKKDNLYRTPLMKAIEAENVEVAKLLLEFGKVKENDLHEVKMLALNSENKELKNLFENFKG